MRILYILIVVSELSCNEQSDKNIPINPAPILLKKVESINEIMQRQTVRTITHFSSTGKDDMLEFGMGVILKGEYLTTCYHLIIPKKAGFKFSKMAIVYNERTINGRFMFDSITLIKDFKPTANQYDFSKHIFRREDRSTDVIVLKLPKPFNIVNYSFSPEQPKYLDTVYSFGNVIKDKIYRTDIQLSQIIIKYSEKNDKSPIYYGYKAKYTHGFSGTPLYNSKGEILAMVQYSIDDNPKAYFKNLQTKGIVSKELVNEILATYKNGQWIQFAIDYTYLKTKYLRGYL
jgi:hypothetical protein